MSKNDAKRQKKRCQNGQNQPSIKGKFAKTSSVIFWLPSFLSFFLPCIIYIYKICSECANILDIIICTFGTRQESVLSKMCLKIVHGVTTQGVSQKHICFSLNTRHVKKKPYIFERPVDQKTKFQFLRFFYDFNCRNIYVRVRLLIRENKTQFSTADSAIRRLIYVYIDE